MRVSYKHANLRYDQLLIQESIRNRLMEEFELTAEEIDDLEWARKFLNDYERKHGRRRQG